MRKYSSLSRTCQVWSLLLRVGQGGTIPTVRYSRLCGVTIASGGVSDEMCLKSLPCRGGSTASKVYIDILRQHDLPGVGSRTWYAHLPYYYFFSAMVMITINITGDHRKLDQIFLVKIVKYVGFVCTVGPIYYGPP